MVKKVLDTGHDVNKDLLGLTVISEYGRSRASQTKNSKQYKSYHEESLGQQLAKRGYDPDIYVT